MSSNPEVLPLHGAARAAPRVVAQPLAIDSVDPGRSVGWWEAAWQLFLRCPLRWVLLGSVTMGCLGLAGLLPTVGLFTTALLSPMFLGGWMLAAQRVHRGGALEARGLLAALRRDHARPLLTLGALLAGATLLMDVVGRALGLQTHLGAVAIDGPSDLVAQAALGHGMLALLLLLVASLLVTAALWFAPALVVLRGATPLRAAGLSLRAVLDNGLTFLLFAVVQLLLLAAAASLLHPAFWLVLLPLMLHTLYVSYREVFDN